MSVCDGIPLAFGAEGRLIPRIGLAFAPTPEPTGYVPIREWAGLFGVGGGDADRTPHKGADRRGGTRCASGGPRSVGFILAGSRYSERAVYVAVEFRTMQLVERAGRVQVPALRHPAQKIW